MSINNVLNEIPPHVSLNNFMLTWGIMAISMTAFAHKSIQDERMLVWELRTVNHRFLDIHVRLPETLSALEPVVRERLAKKLNRGKVEAVLRHQGNHSSARLNFNDNNARELADRANKARQYFPEAKTDLLAILAWPGILEAVEVPAEDTLTAPALALLDQAIADLLDMRRCEGLRIKHFIQHRIGAIQRMLEVISQQIPQLISLERERILARVAEFKLEINSQRLEQEMLILIQKTDVAEEIQRLRSHCEAMNEALEQSGTIGRRMDFLSQELNREANTLSSKVLSISLTEACIEIKVWIEQIREQVQNIE